MTRLLRTGVHRKRVQSVSNSEDCNTCRDIASTVAVLGAAPRVRIDHGTTGYQWTIPTLDSHIERGDENGG